MDELTVHILVIEDEEAHVELIRRAFKAGADRFHLTVVGSLEEARASLAKSCPDLVIADLLLPDGRGIELLPAESERASFPMVVMTSHGNEQAAVEAIKAGALDYVVKSAMTLTDMPHVAESALREWGHITERRRAEEALRASEHRLKIILDSAQAGITIIDAEARTIVDANPAALRMIGAARDQVIGSVCHQFICPAEQGRCPVCDLGQSVDNSERVLLTANGEKLPIIKTVVTVMLGSRKCLVESFIDITERKRAEQALRESEERFRTVANFTYDWEYWVGVDRNYVYVSPSCERVTGYRPDEFLKKPELLEEIVHPDDRAAIAAHLHEGFDSQEAFGIDFRIMTRSGQERWVNHVCQPVRDANGRWMGRRASNRDITERKQAEEEIRRLNQDLERHARELAALNTAGQAITSTLDLRTVLELVMTEVKSLMDTEGASVLLRDSAPDELVFAAVAGPGAEKLIGARMPATAGIAGWVMQKGQSALVSDARRDPRFYDRLDGTSGLVTRSLLAVPLAFKGVTIGVVEVVNKASGDFTEHDLKLLETVAGSAAIAIENARLYQAEQEQYQRLQQSQAQLVQAEKMSALGRLAAALAHEINNPLQAITSHLELVMDFALEPDERVERLRITHQEIDRLSEIARRVLNFARPSPAPRKLVFVADLVQQTLALAGKKLQHSHIEVTTDLREAPPILASPDQLVQVFLNLVLNAIESIYDHGHIHITLGAEDNQVVVRFANDGPSIPPEDLPRVFEPFFTTKENGTGLGLSVSHSLVTQHGGTLIAENLPNDEGVVFTVRLPMAKSEE